MGPVCVRARLSPQVPVVYLTRGLPSWSCGVRWGWEAAGGPARGGWAGLCHRSSRPLGANCFL